MENIITKLKNKVIGRPALLPRTTRKIRKHVVEMRVKTAIEKWGGTYLYINWKKQKVHLLTPTKQKKVESLSLSFR